VLVLDDASTDRTYDVAAAFVDPRLRVTRAERKLGGYQAMNRLIASARGELLAVYHADDVYEPTIVEKEVAHLRAHPDVGAVFARDYNIDEEGQIIRTVNLPAEFAGRVALDYETVFRYQVRKKNPFCCPTFMTRRTVVDQVGVFDPQRWDIAADVDMWLRIARRFPVSVLDEPLVRYRKGRHNWSARYRRLRTEPDVYFAVIDAFMARDGWNERLSPEDLTEYEFHRCDDDTYRAANSIIKGEDARARELLQGRRFPWRTLRAGTTRRKLRLIALRAILAAGLATGATRPLARLLRHVGP
jgi:glycosyltransferase involved in cell wall biosynthesis